MPQHGAHQRRHGSIPALSQHLVPYNPAMHVLVTLMLLAPQGTAIGPSGRLWQSQAFNGERCGYSLGISGDRAIVGAPLKDENELAVLAYGAAHVFHFDGTTWTEEAVLEELPQLTQPLDYVGTTVALQGDT